MTSTTVKTLYPELIKEIAKRLNYTVPEHNYMELQYISEKKGWKLKVTNRFEKIYH